MNAQKILKFINKTLMENDIKKEYCYFCKIQFYDASIKNYGKIISAFNLDDKNKLVLAHENCVNENKIHGWRKNEIDNVNHPHHYGGESNVYEAIKIIEHYHLGFCLGNTLKYIVRAGKKDEQKYIEDLEKAQWYLQRKINQLKNENK